MNTFDTVVWLCCGMPKFNTVPIPVAPVLEAPWVNLYPWDTLAITIQVGQILRKVRNPDNWLYQPNKHSEEALQHTKADAQLIRKLASIRTPNPNSGFAVPTNTATSQAPAVLKPLPAYHTKEDPLTEEPLEGGPNV